jgi:hypothetical protein
MVFGELLEEGPRLDRETRERQERKVSPKQSDYIRRYCLLGDQSEGAETWGAFVQGRLAAYLIAHRMGDCANILIVRSATSMLPHYPNNALVYEYASKVLAEGPSRELSFGFESLQEGLDALDHFKERMGFKREPVGQRLELAPWLKPTLGKESLRRWLMKATGGKGETFGKLVGTLRWFEEQNAGPAPAPPPDEED